MSVAEDDTGHQHHHKSYQPSPARSRNPQEYRDNHLINKQILNITRRQSLSPIGAHPNSSNNTPVVVEPTSDDETSQDNDTPNSTTIPSSSNQSHLTPPKDFITTTTPSPSTGATMRASRAGDTAKVPSPTPAPSTTATNTTANTTTNTTTVTLVPLLPLSPPNSNPHEAETIKENVSPVPSNDSTNATVTAITAGGVDGEGTPQSKTQTRPKVTTPASPPPSPPSAAGTAVTMMGTGTVDSPLALLSATVRSNTATPVRGGSLASLLHSAHREVDVPESTNERRGGDGNGTPLSPTSMSRGTHSRKDSAATMASASTGTTGTGAGTGTEMDVTSLKGGSGGGGGEPMDVDPSSTAPLQHHLSGVRSASQTPTGLGNKTAPLPYHPSRSPQPQPQQQQQQQHPPPPGTMPSSLGPQHRPQPTPSPPTLNPSAHSQPSKSPYPHSGHSGVPPGAVAATTQQRSLSRHGHSRSQSGRTGGMTNPNPAAGPPQPHPTPRALSPHSQLRSFVRSDMPGPPTASDERDREYPGGAGPGPGYDEMRNQIAHLVAQNEELLAQRDYQARVIERLESKENRQVHLVREWIKSGEGLLNALVETLGDGRASSFGRRGHSYALEPSGERDHERERERDRAPLSSVHRQYADLLERDKTLSVVLPVSPYTPGPHTRPGSGYGPSPDYPYRHAATPTHPESSHLSRGAGHTPRPTHHSTGSNSLRRSRRPSSDDLAEHGGKRIKANNGTFIRTSPDAAERASHSGSHPGPLSASSIGHALGRSSALGVGRDGAGEFTSYPTSHNRGSASLGSGTEHGRESPLNRRTVGGRDEDEDEFPSPRRSHAVPPGVQPPTGNGHTSVPTAGKPAQARVAALIAASEDVDAIGSPDIDTAGHETLMEMVEEEDAESPKRGHGGTRHVRESTLRNGSRSSMNSQDIDDMIAEVADDDRSRRGMRSAGSAKPRYRGPGSSTNLHTGGALSTFPVHLGQHPDAMSPGQTRSYTPSSQPSSAKFMPTSAASPAPQSANSRGFVFRNTDVADMEAIAQARSPEELGGHRASLSGSGSFNGAQTSPSGAAGNPVTTQFLPPQSGPPQPKKIYHSKGTGQVIGSQHAATMERVPTMPVEAVVQPRPLVPSSSLTADGLPKRTCKQCGQPGRYKDNKCVEKWGPGPQGPGTVCDRCRKKMKRVEKRATQDSAAMNAAMNHHQYPIAPAPSGSLSQLSNQGSQRFDESQEFGFSQATEDAQSQPSLSRASSQNHSSILQTPQAPLGRRGSHAPDQSMHRDATLPYPPHPSNPARETMPPPTSFYESQRAVRSTRRDPSADTRDGDLDADGDAEMDELVDDEIAAAADASAGGRRRDQAVKPEA